MIHPSEAYISNYGEHSRLHHKEILSSVVSNTSILPRKSDRGSGLLLNRGLFSQRLRLPGAVVVVAVVGEIRTNTLVVVIMAAVGLQIRRISPITSAKPATV